MQPYRIIFALVIAMSPIYGQSWTITDSLTTTVEAIHPVATGDHLSGTQPKKVVVDTVTITSRTLTAPSDGRDYWVLDYRDAQADGKPIPELKGSQFKIQIGNPRFEISPISPTQSVTPENVARDIDSLRPLIISGKVAYSPEDQNFSAFLISLLELFGSDAKQSSKPGASEIAVEVTADRDPGHAHEMVLQGIATYAANRIQVTLGNTRMVKATEKGDEPGRTTEFNWKIGIKVSRVFTKEP